MQGRMTFHDDVNWPEVFGEYIARPSLADPANRRRATYVSTMLFLEAGLRELELQLSGRSKRGRDDLGWATITRDIVVKGARRIAAEELPAAARLGLAVGESGFRERWRGWGAMFNFMMCLVRYACTGPRWRASIEFGPRRALAEVPRVKAGEVTLADVISKIAVHDLRLRVRLAKYWLFQLSLTLDAKWKAVAGQAYRELLEAYADRWVPVYDEAVRALNVRLRPGMTAKKLSAMISAQIAGFAEHIAGTGDVSYIHGEDSVELFAESVQLLIYAAIDSGGGHDIATALNETINRALA
jgi:hypothetical protein